MNVKHSIKFSVFLEPCGSVGEHPAEDRVFLNSTSSRVKVVSLILRLGDPPAYSSLIHIFPRLVSPVIRY